MGQRCWDEEGEAGNRDEHVLWDKLGNATKLGHYSVALDYF